MINYLTIATAVIICSFLCLLVLRNTDKKMRLGIISSWFILLVIYVLVPATAEYLGYIAIAYVVVLANAFKKTLKQLGYLLNLVVGSASNKKAEKNVIDVLARSIDKLSKKKIGAIIALLPKGAKLDNSILSGGVVLNALLSVELILSIFWKGTPLHDGIAIVNGKLLHKAGAVVTNLPADPELPDIFEENHLGTRHRASYTLSFYYVVVTVSEETGDVSVMEDGKVIKVKDITELKKTLKKRLS